MKICAFDIETHGLNGTFVSGALWADNGAQYWTDQPAFVEALRWYAGNGYTLFAHNAEYDIIHGLWEAGEDVTMHFYDQSFNRGTWRYGKGKKTAEIWDSMNLAAGQALASVGKAMHLPKLETPQRLRGLDPDKFKWICDRHAVGECLECYNLRDAEIVYRFIDYFASWMEGMGLKMGRTLGTNAIRLWHYFDPGQQQGLRGKLVVDMARQSFHGARVETFMVGEINGLYTYDIRRHYAAVMLNSPMPDCRGLTYVENPKEMTLDNIEGVIDASVSVPNVHIPPLPVKAVDGGVYYATGRFRGCFVIAELRAAVMRGVIVDKVHRIAYSKRVCKPFEITTLALVNLRNEWESKGDPRAFHAKVTLYSIYGRLGVRDEQEYRTYARHSRILTESDIEGKRVQWIGNLRYVIAEYRVKMRSRVQNVLWAATVTAYGRLQLLRHLEAAGQSLAYCDTDSVFATSPLPVGDNAPGSLRDTGHYQKGYIYGPKLYRLESGDTPDKWVARGIPKQLALEFLEDGSVSFPATVSVVQAAQTAQPAGSWQTLIRRHRNAFTRRHISDALALRKEGGYSMTTPVTFYLEPSERDFAYLPSNVNLNRRQSPRPAVATGPLTFDQPAIGPGLSPDFTTGEPQSH